MRVFQVSDSWRPLEPLQCSKIMLRQFLGTVRYPAFHGSFEGIDLTFEQDLVTGHDGQGGCIFSQTP